MREDTQNLQVMNLWIIRNPYLHRTWSDIIHRDSYILHGIRGASEQCCIASMQTGDQALFYDRKTNAFQGILEVLAQAEPDRNDDRYKEISFKPVFSFNPPIYSEVLVQYQVYHESRFVRQPRFTVCKAEPGLYEFIMSKRASMPGSRRMS